MPLPQRPTTALNTKNLPTNPAKGGIPASDRKEKRASKARAPGARPAETGEGFQSHRCRWLSSTDRKRPRNAPSTVNCIGNDVEQQRSLADGRVRQQAGSTC